MSDTQGHDDKDQQSRDELDQASSALESQMRRLKRRYSSERRKLEERSFQPKDDD